jgi:hypothetical protein
MSNDVKKVEITIGAKSKKGTGIKDGGETWFNASRGVSFDSLQRGEKVLLTYVENGEGGRFVTAYTKTNVASVPAIAPAVIAPAPVAVTASTATVAPAPISDEKMSKADWNAKDYKITKGGVAHDAATIVAAMSAMKTDEEVKALFSSLFAHILKVVLE